mmetsp:Transcript_6903/g.15059  ORF Transcript_6903/g.15059 Transcript_6903/m.15059 type:complete len:1264 (+) Transcript_6903:96-3887(+)|eukprot:CAMPEP_0178388074 /NCGR_PEP_ID=MMETSP0689_2-20121128/9403_1 /TAXON_ID=160604 /ORGANISM="Amphidinium massartii, Strain CS-259" /LENGTH=1263 /DNA_ID=CAMNT_0020008461 /DNA_START=42 /DNA_END=3833 /DNA_ORIENTATION=+
MFVRRSSASHPQFRNYSDADDWSKDLQGKLEEVKALLPLREETKQELQQYLGEVASAAVKGDVSTSRAAELLAKAPVKAREPLQHLLGDVLWLGAFVTSDQDKARSENKAEFENLCIELQKAEVLSPQQIALALETESIPEKVCQGQIMRKKINQLRTKQRYTLTRYNLYRENSDGFAKLLYLLDCLSNLEFRPQVTPAQAIETQQCIAKDVLSLIGHHHLCPNRTVAAVMDILEARLQQAPTTPAYTWAHPLVAILRLFPRKRLTSVSIFEVFSHTPLPQKDAKVVEPNRLSNRASPTNFLAISALAKVGLVDLDAVWTYLEPSDEVLKTSHAELTQAYEEDVARVTKVDLSGQTDGEAQKFVKCLQAWNCYADQKLKLAAALISVNHWTLANRVLLHLGSLCKPCLNHYIRSALCDLLKWLIEPALEGVLRAPLASTNGDARCFDLKLVAPGEEEGAGSENTGLQQTTNLEELLPQVRQVLDHLEYFFHTDAHLMHALWRLVFKCIVYREQGGASSTVVTEECLLSIMFRHLLPAASIASPNPFLNDAMWAAVSKLSVSQRYLLYSCWETMNEKFLVKLAAERTISSAKQILKRVVSNADRRDFIAHNAHYHFSKLCVCNPIPAIETMLRSLEIGFNVNMIQPYVECTRGWSDMTEDVVGYMLARNCAKPQTAGRMFLNQADALLNPWLVNLSEFVGRFYKKHPDAELSGVLTVITKRINSEGTDPFASGAGSGPKSEYLGESLIRVVLESLMENMGGLVTVADMNAEQLHCLAGGPRLRQESTAYGIDKKKEDHAPHRKERARAALFNAIRDVGLVRVLLYSLSQQRYHFLSEEFSDSHSGAGGMKLLGLLFDGNRECFLKLIEFLSQACPSDKYYAMLPPVEELFAMFEPALAFHILRHGMTSYGRSSSSSASASVANDGDAATAGKTRSAASSATAHDKECHIELAKVVRSYLPASFESEWLSADFYLTFWRLGLQDVMVPKDGYDKTIGSMSSKLQDLNLQRKKMEREERERDLVHNRDYKALKKEIQKLTDSQKLLKDEHAYHRHNFKKVEMRLEAEKAGWVLKAGESAAAATAFVTEMLCPRLLTSPADALFCSNFVKLLFNLKTPGFKLSEVYNTWTIMIPQFIRCCTEREAEILGIFIREMMSYILQLRKEEHHAAKLAAAESKAAAAAAAAAAADADAAARHRTPWDLAATRARVLPRGMRIALVTLCQTAPLQRMQEMRRRCGSLAVALQMLLTALPLFLASPPLLTEDDQ